MFISRRWRRKNAVHVAEYERRWHGLTNEQYAHMVLDQRGRCAICRSSDSRGRRGSKWHIDHDHATGLIRGLLCSPCNIMLGMARDDPTTLAAAMSYLKDPPATRTTRFLRAVKA